MVDPVDPRQLAVEALQPEASNRAIADAIGVTETTVRRDIADATNVAPEPEEASIPAAIEAADATNVAPEPDDEEEDVDDEADAGEAEPDETDDEEEAMTPNKAKRSPRTEGSEAPREAAGSPRTRAIKRGTNTAYLSMRLARDHPQIWAQLHAGAFPSVRAAAKAAGLIKALTPLEKLRRAWRRASGADQMFFLLEVHQGDTISLRGPHPLPKRLSRRQAWELWRDQLLEIRQHMRRLHDAGVVFTKGAQVLTPDARAGYAAELRGFIDDLTTMLTQMERAAHVSRAQP
jgi:hypothetical protein